MFDKNFNILNCGGGEPSSELAMFDESTPEFSRASFATWDDAANRGGVYARFVKRPMDILLAGIALLGLSPVIAVAALLVRLDGGPAFFAQQRVGRNGRLFKCWKLRTMRVDAERLLKDICAADPEMAAEWQQFQKLKHDVRITPIGHRLRGSSLDELPQFWNVLIGDMSLVGPRPMLKDQEQMYRSAGGTGYFSLRPGITGPWQVDGRGTTKFLDRISYDNHYFQAVAFKSDVSYILKTVRVVLLRTGH